MQPPSIDFGRAPDSAWHPFERAWQQPPFDSPYRVRPDDPDYQRQLAAEIEFWSKPQLFCVESEEGTDTPAVRHANYRFTGDERVGWYETLHNYGDFRRGVAIGAGGILQARRILELNPRLHLTFVDVSDTALTARQELEGAFPGRVGTVKGDLNFVDLGGEQFDFIVSSSTMHHVINIEHLAGELAKALTHDGYMFIQDYTAETRFAWRNEKRKIIEGLVQREWRRRSRDGCDVRWIKKPVSDFSPFEAIRSEDTLDVMARTFREVVVRGTGAITFASLFVEQPDVREPERRGWNPWKRMPAARFEEEVQLVDDAICDAGLLPAVNSFAVYRSALC
jgi:SAM-dependent methyltransferase